MVPSPSRRPAPKERPSTELSIRGICTFVRSSLFPMQAYVSVQSVEAKFRSALTHTAARHSIVAIYVASVLLFDSGCGRRTGSNVEVSEDLSIHGLEQQIGREPRSQIHVDGAVDTFE